MNMLEVIGAFAATKCKGETEVSVQTPSGKILPIGDISHIGEWTGDGKESITIHLDDDDGVQRLRDAAEELIYFLSDFANFDMQTPQLAKLRELLK